MNITILKCARHKRLHSRLPLNTWAKDVNTIVYVINRGLSTPLRCGILEEAHAGKKVSYSFLKTFGCEDFLHIDSKNISNVVDKSKKWFFFLYGIDEFG